MSAPRIGQPHLFAPPPQVTLTLRDRFLVPPFSVLDARAGYWQERKRSWLEIGIKGELGRDHALLAEGETGDGGAALDSSQGRSGNLLHSGVVREEMSGQWDVAKGESAWGGAGTSVFDPVLCELAYRWYAPEGGHVVDPFAGGSVRGIVAAALGRRYTGTDLSLPQCEANYLQSAVIGKALGWEHYPTWEHGDARDFLDYVPAGSADLIFTCPPYYDLEVYSSNPHDLSAAPSYPRFLEGYRQCIAAAAQALKPDRFALFVVGEVRDKRSGSYVGLVPDTIHACEEAGLSYYNEGILVTSVGSLPIRTSRLFGPGRKLGKTHQNLLCFVKGSWRAAAAACSMPEEVALEYGGATWSTSGQVELGGETLDLAALERT